MIVLPSIEPGTNPDGVVVHVYDQHGKSVLIRRALGGGSDAEKLALEDMMHARQIQPDGCFFLVAFDGDTGECREVIRMDPR